MRGFYFNKGDSFSSELGLSKDGLRLLAKQGNLEIMQQHIVKGAVVWLVPVENQDDLDFFYVHSGRIDIITDELNESFAPGDSFYVRDLKDETFLKVREDSELVYVSTAPVFDDQAAFQKDLLNMVAQINRKDDYTYVHSRNVMHYSVKLFTALKELCPAQRLEDMVVSALFHDIGKCRVPDEILKKKEALTGPEYEQMKMHTVFGAELLAKYYPEGVTGLVLRHHERLDGSGYPFHLSGDEIPFAARILAVADSFDAMTTDRGYNKPMDALQAARELAGEADKYDRRVTEKLLEMVRSGELKLEGK